MFRVDDYEPRSPERELRGVPRVGGWRFYPRGAAESCDSGAPDLSYLHPVPGTAVPLEILIRLWSGVMKTSEIVLLHVGIILVS